MLAEPPARTPPVAVLLVLILTTAELPASTPPVPTAASLTIAVVVPPRTIPPVAVLLVLIPTTAELPARRFPRNPVDVC